MKILIIGSGGQLGTDCINILGEKHDIYPIDFPEIDIAAPESVQKAFADTKPEAVINCAAYTAVDLCETEVKTCWRINADGPKHIAEAAEQAGCRVIHVSTDYVFDGNKEVPGHYLETDPVNPLSEYGRSKLAGERNVAAGASDYIILRTAWLYSGYGNNFLKTMLRLALSDPKKAFTIVDDQYGSLTWSHTLARQIETLLKSELQGIAHTTATGYSSWYEAACYFLEKMEVPHSFVPCTTKEYPTPAHRPANSILENSVLEKSGISVFRSWQEDLDQFVLLFKEKLLQEVRAKIG